MGLGRDRQKRIRRELARRKAKDKDNYRWVQLVARQPEGEHVYGNFIQLSNEEACGEWSEQFGGRDVFHTICAYAAPHRRARYVAPLYFHVHSRHGVDIARKGTLRLRENVLETMDCPPDCLQLYFDGKSGFELLVPFQVFDAFYSPHILSLYAELAGWLNDRKEYIIDRTIYSEEHLWRLPNSRPGKARLHKVQLTPEELLELSPAEILAVAASPRTENVDGHQGPDKSARRWYRREIRWLPQKFCRQCDFGTNQARPEVAPCVQALKSTVLPDGTRHATYVRLACYFAYLNMHYPDIVARLGAIDSDNPIRDPKDIEEAAAFGCRHPSPLECDSVLRRFCARSGCELCESKHRPAR